MPDTLKSSKGSNELYNWSFRMGVGCVDNDHTAERLAVRKLWRRPKYTHGAVAPVKMNSG
jgi:hypothetical protein